MSIEKLGRLELGQSQFELIEFSLLRHLDDGTVIKGRYGVNVAKVREVVRMPKINKLSSRIDSVAGVFELRGTPIPAINLAKVLGDAEAPIDDSQQIIVTEFSRKRAGFIVSSTQRIRRVAWDKVLPPATDAGTCINGMAFVDDNEFLFILDLEKILIEIEMQGGQPRASLLDPGTPSAEYPLYAASEGGKSAPAVAPGSRGKVFLIDDSALILNSCKKALESLGFAVTTAKDGQIAKEFLEEATLKDPNNCPIDVVVSDVEMPRLDGLTLTKWIRNSSSYPNLPILLHTSLSGQANQAAGISMGANGYVIKNDIKVLVELLSEIIGKHDLAS